jgi:hypothetical protein
MEIKENAKLELADYQKQILKPFFVGKIDTITCKNSYYSQSSFMQLFDELVF